MRERAKSEIFYCSLNYYFYYLRGLGKKIEDLLVFVLFFSSGFVYFCCSIMSNIFNDK